MMSFQERSIQIQPENVSNTSLSDKEFHTPDLLDDNKYHAMISYTSEERDWMIRLLEHMEEPPYNLKCCIHERDFDGGKEVITNIEVCMYESMSVILLLTPEHLNSGYCDLETKIALQMKQEGKVTVIPVLRRGDHIPQYLRFITYIDARDGVDEQTVINRITMAVATGLPENAELFNINQKHYENGDEVRILSKCEGGLLRMFSLPEMTRRQLVECKKVGFEVSDSFLKSLSMLPNQSAFCGSYWWFMRHVGRLIVTVWFLSMAFPFCGLLVCLPQVYGEYRGALIGLLTVLPPLSITALVLLMILKRKSMQAEKISISRRMTLRTRTNKMLVLLDVEANKPCMRLVYYNFNKCLDYMKKQRMDQLNFEGNPEESTFDMDEIIDLAEGVLKNALSPYISYMMVAFPPAPTPRHTVRRDLMCLCQFIELMGITYTGIDGTAISSFTTPGTLYRDQSPSI